MTTNDFDEEEDGAIQELQPQTIARVELDQQVATAKAYPRSIKRFVDKTMSMVTLNQGVAEECIYALPRGGKTIEGPSIRMAEIVASTWGNCRVGARIIEEGTDYIVAEGVFQDVESNVHVTRQVRRRIVDKNGRRFNADMIGVASNAACSVAHRNAVFASIPKALWEGCYRAARLAAVGDITTLANTRAKALEYLQKQGVPAANVFHLLGVAGIEDIGIDHVATLKGLSKAMMDGETTPEEAFPAPPSAESKPAATKKKKGLDGLEDRIIGGDADQEAAQ